MSPKHPKKPLLHSHLLFTSSIVLSCIILDQITKEIARTTLRSRGMLSYLGDLFRFHYSENPGAFLSLGAGLSAEARFWSLSVAVGMILAAGFVYLWKNRQLPRLSVVLISLVLGGGVSNLIDRVFRPNHCVVDFMNMGIGRLRTGIFNVADMAIMAGVIGLALGGLLQPSKD